MSYVVTCLHVRRQMAKAAVIMESSFGFSLASIVWEGRSTDSKHRRSREEEQQQQRRSSDRLKRATRTQVNNFCAPLPTRCITPLVLNQRVGEKRCQKICTTCPKLSVQYIVNHYLGTWIHALSEASCCVERICNERNREDFIRNYTSVYCLER